MRLSRRGIPKEPACEQVLKLLGIPKERAYVFGDSSNDLDMFRFADHAVAMGKHAEVLEPYTEFCDKNSGRRRTGICYETLRTDTLK